MFTWGSVVVTILLFILCIYCLCCCCKCCCQCGFWLWDKWTPKQCLCHTKERCCVITNINADRVSYHEVAPSPPSTPVMTHSVPIPIQERPHSRYRESNTRRRSPTRLSSSMELVQFHQQPRTQERKGER
jgi:hypothetical protein